MSCLSHFFIFTGYCWGKVWCHPGFRRWVKSLQHVGSGSPPYGHLWHGQLLSLHARECRALDRRQRWGLRGSHKSSTGDMWGPTFWLVKLTLPTWIQYYISEVKPNTSPCCIGTIVERQLFMKQYSLCLYHSLWWISPLFCCFFFVVNKVNDWSNCGLWNIKKRI